jgi:hypothetical protein
MCLHRYLYCQLAIFLLVMTTVPLASGQTVDPNVNLLRRATTPQRDRNHLNLLASLRQLRDPELRGVFYQLVPSAEWQIQVHALLGLAELDAENGLDPWLITQLQPEARQAVIANALDSELLTTEQIQEILKWDDLEQIPKLLLYGALTQQGESIPIEKLIDLSDDPNLRVSGFSSSLLSQRGDSGALDNFSERLSTRSKKEKFNQLVYVFDFIRQHKLTKAVPWVYRQLEDPNLDADAGYWGLYTILSLDPEQGADLWLRLLGPDPSHRQKVRFALLILESGAPVTATVREALGSDDVLINKMLDAGEPINAGQTATEQLTALLELQHLKTTDWIIRQVDEMPADQSTPLLVWIIERVGDANETSEDSFMLAIIAASKLAEINPGVLRSLLREAKDDSARQQAILMGLLASPIPELGNEAKSLRRIGLGRADSLATILMARHLEELEPADLQQLKVIAAGGGRVADVIQIQAAWLYLRHTDSVERALAEVFEEQ